MELKPPASTVKAPASNFTGDVYVTPIIKEYQQLNAG